ncbi:unnamed protein product [Schistosoma turkestanicum]|nr:unnamed protein product [Schistosoma turkestanicum]
MKKKKLQSRNHNPTSNNGINSNLSETGNDMIGKEGVECMLEDGDDEDEDGQMEDDEDEEEEEEEEEGEDDEGEEEEEEEEDDDEQDEKKAVEGNHRHHLQQHQQQQQQYNRIINNCDSHRYLYGNNNNNNELNLKGQLKQIALMKKLDKISDTTIEEYDEDCVRNEKFKINHEFLNLSPDLYSTTPLCFTESINDYENNHPFITDASNNNNSNSNNNDNIYSRMKFNRLSHELFPSFHYNSSLDSNLMNAEFNFNPVNINMDHDSLFDPLKESLRSQLVNPSKNKHLSSPMGWPLVNSSSNNNNNNNVKEYDINLPSSSSSSVTTSFPTIKTTTESINYFSRLSSPPKLDLQTDYCPIGSMFNSPFHSVVGLTSNYSTHTRRSQQIFDVPHNQLHQQQGSNINQSEICDFMHSPSENDNALQLTEHNLSLGNQSSLTRIPNSALHTNSNCLSKTCPTDSYFQKSLNYNEKSNILPQFNPSILYDNTNESTVDLTTNTTINTNIHNPTSFDIPSRNTMNIMNYNLNVSTVNDSHYYMNPIESNQSYTLNLDCSPLSHYSFLPNLTVTSSSLGTKPTTCWPTHKYLSPPPGSYPLQSINPDTTVTVTASDDIDQPNESFSNSMNHEVSFRKNVFHSLQNSTDLTNNHTELDPSNLLYLSTSMNVCSTTLLKDSHNSNRLNFSDHNDSGTFPIYSSQLNSSCHMNTNDAINSYLSETDVALITDHSNNQEDHSMKQNSSLKHYPLPSNTNLSPLHHLNNVFNQVNHGELSSMFYSPYLHNSNSFGYSSTGNDMLTITDSYNSNVFNNLTQSMHQSFNQSTHMTPISSSSSSSYGNTFTMNTTIHLNNLRDTTSNINNVTIPFPMIPANTSSVDLSST